MILKNIVSWYLIFELRKIENKIFCHWAVEVAAADEIYWKLRLWQTIYILQVTIFNELSRQKLIQRTHRKIVITIFEKGVR